MARVFIALGSNIEPKRAFINSAIKKLSKERDMEVIKCSSLFDTYPVGTPSNKRFLNSVAELNTSLRPRELLTRLLEIEKSLGRIRLGENRPRTIDLDILLYDDLIIKEKGLAIPHPRMHNRDFVLFGMNEIAPSTIHPVLNKSMSELHARRPMAIFRSPKKLYQHVILLKKKDKRIGFVPTMGYLHEGHTSLIRKAREENDIVVVSIFVNPAQFGPREDFVRYPRDFSRDKRMLRKEGADIIFYPSVKSIFGDGHSTYVNVEKISQNLCGRFRVGHFRGVATIVAKLFNIVPADNAYFGQKDAQQTFIIKRMVRDLNIPVDVHVLPTVRERDGLAMSSRNASLKKNQRQEATILYKSLLLARGLIGKGERRANIIVKRMRDLIESKSSARIEYISVVDTENLEDLKRLKGETLIALAAYFGKTRLIDNIIVRV